MEQTWVTDKFYSHFPSYTDQQQRQKATLIETRKQDYQNYLKQMSTNDVNAHHRKYSINNNHRDTNIIENGIEGNHLVGETFITRATIETSGSSLFDSARGRSSRPRDSKHTDLPDLFDDEAIRERNRRVVEEDHLKKMEYHRDLLVQIEQKRKEHDVQKAKEKEYDEKLTRKLEEHLRSVRLEEEHESARQHNQVQTNSTPAHTNDFLDEIEADFRTRYQIYDKRKAQSETGKENRISYQKNDKTIYNYFTNSARNYTDSSRSGQPEFNQDDLASIASSLQVVGTKKSHSKETYCRRCQNVINTNEDCNYCKHGHRKLTDDIPDTLYLCYNCRNRTLCSNCMREICSKCRKRKKPRATHLPNDGSNSRPIGHRKVITQFLHDERTIDKSYEHDGDDSDSEHELDVDLFSPIVIKRNNAPYSLYLEKSSIFHPMRHEAKLSVNVRNGEVIVEKDHDDLEEIRRITNEKRIKYNKNGLELNGRKVKNGDGFPLPSISEVQQKSPIKNAKLYAASVRDSPAFKMLEQLELDESELDQFNKLF